MNTNSQPYEKIKQHPNLKQFLIYEYNIDQRTYSYQLIEKVGQVATIKSVRMVFLFSLDRGHESLTLAYRISLIAIIGHPFQLLKMRKSKEYGMNAELMNNVPYREFNTCSILL